MNNENQPPSLPAVPDTKEEEKQTLGEPRAVEANTAHGPMERPHILASAAYWFKGSRNAQDDGHHAEAVMFMENAYNHVENALAAAADLLCEAHGRMGNTAFPALAARIARFLEQVSSVPEQSKSDAGSEFSQTGFETGGRNALNLQMAQQEIKSVLTRIQDELNAIKTPYDSPTVEAMRLLSVSMFKDMQTPLQRATESLLSAQAASDGKEQGEPAVTHARPISKEKTQCHTDETKQRDEQRGVNTPAKSAFAPAERPAEGTATETTSRDARPGSSGSVGAFCPERLRSDNAAGASSPKSSSSATVRGPMDAAYGAWREADDLIIVKLPGLEEFRISNEGAERLHADFAKICRAPSGIEGQPAQTEFREALDIVLRDRDALHDQYEKDIEFLNEQFDGIPVSHLAEEGWEETVRCLREIGKKLTEIRTRKWSFGSSPPSPPLPDNGEAVQTKGLEE